MATINLADGTLSKYLCAHDCTGSESFLLSIDFRTKEVDLVTYMCLPMSIFVPTNLPDQSSEDDNKPNLIAQSNSTPLALPCSY